MTIPLDGIWMNESLTPLDVYQRRITTVYCYRRSPNQEICIAEAGAYGKTLLLDGQLQCSTADEFLYHEALVHPPLIQHSSPREVLIVGGGDGAAAREAFRWRSVQRVTIVEVDQEVVDACREHLPEIHQKVFDDPRLELVFDDGFHFLRQAKRKWDVILFDLPDPAETAPWLKLYERECFEIVNSRLSSSGAFALQAGPVSPVEVMPLTQIVKGVKRVFSCVHVYSSFVPSFGIPLAFVLAANRPIVSLPNPEVIDQLITEKVCGGLKLLDGAAFLGLMQTPAYLREALDRDQE